MANSDLLKGYYVYEYTFLDDLSFVRTPQEYAASRFAIDIDPEKLDTWVAAVRERFFAAGWEGDGTIGLIWLPPFVDIGIEDTWGNYIWHVKQRNNGISFLLSPCPLDFQRIREQNEDWPRGQPRSIVDAAVEVLRTTATKIADELATKLASTSAIKDAVVVGRIRHDLLAHSQGMLIRTLHEFLDDCYLKLLIEAMNGNRSKLKLRKSRVQLTPDRYLPEEADEDETHWFTVQGVVSDMWHAYKYEPYKSKLEMLFRGVDYELDEKLGAFLAKHITLRNCLQHRDGYLDLESLDQLGVKKITMRGQKGDTTLRKGDDIVFTVEEVSDLCAALLRLAADFNAHVWKRVVTREYVVRP